MRIFSIIVCFNPDIESLKKLVESILDQSSEVVIVDNSSSKKLIDLGNCKIISLNSNKGISYAQNRGIEYAKKKSSDIFVFFDQDSEINKNFFKSLMKKMDLDIMSVFSPLVIDKKTDKILPSVNLNRFGITSKVFYNRSSSFNRVDLIISSGSAINRKALDCVGLMDENLFIDFVDTDFCFRCIKKNIPIYIMPEAILKHSIGQSKYTFFNLTFFKHDNERIYYQVRNCIYFFKKKYVPKLFVLKEFFSILFHSFFLIFLSNDKMGFLRNFFLGFKDGLVFIIK